MMVERLKFSLSLLTATIFLISASPQSLPEKTDSAATATSQSNSSQAQPTPPAQPAAAQTPPPQTKLGELSGMVLKVTTKMVLVDTVVTGKDGKPVSGLKAQDFEILEDGVKQEIRAFGVNVPPRPDAPLPPHVDLAPGTFTNTVEFHPEEGPPLIVVFDALNTPWADQVYGRQQFVDYLKKNVVRRNVAIYALGRRLRMIQDFTGNTELVRQQLDKAQAQKQSSTGYSEAQNDAPPSASPVMPSAGASNNPAQFLATVQEQLSEAQKAITNADRDRAIATTLQAFRSIARHAAALPGRKQLVWLSAGFPLNFEVLKETPFMAEFQETSDLLTDAQIAVYPVDVRGLVAFFPLEMRGGMARLNANHMSMNYVAARTGGMALYERNDVDHAIGIALDDGATYYALGYYPSNKKWDGEFRRIQVKVRRGGLKVRCRSGYYAVDPTHRNESQETRSRSEFVAALKENAESAGMLPFFAQVLPRDKERPQVEIEIRVDPYSVLFLLQPNGDRQAELEFATMVLDAKDKVIATKFDTLNANLTPATFAQVMKNSLAIRQKLDLAPGNYKLRVGVRDVKSNLIGTLPAHVEVNP